jgi:hypothetical protein
LPFPTDRGQPLRLTVLITWRAEPHDVESLTHLRTAKEFKGVVAPSVGDRIFADPSEQLAGRVVDRLLHDDGNLTLRLEPVYGSDGWDLDLIRSWGYT